MQPGNKNEGREKRRPPARHIDPYGIRQGDDADDGERDAGLIEGRNAVMEALRAGVSIDKVFIIKGEADPAIRYIASTARAAGAAVVDADRRKLDAMSSTHAHQGVIAQAAFAEYATIGDILDAAAKKGEAPLVVMCDGIEDPHNLGAIIRSCEAAGAHGIIIPKRRSAGTTAAVAKASSGAVYHIPIARVSNLVSAITELKKSGVWIYGASAGGETPLWESDLTGPAAIVIGSEGAGIGRLVSENCDYNVSIPMFGKISSLNASVSAAILLYEALRQRRG